jgi:hypothetical protein
VFDTVHNASEVTRTLARYIVNARNEDVPAAARREAC